jgi:DNA-binding GntR family transcriptional regulator
MPQHLDPTVDRAQSMSAAIRPPTLVEAALREFRNQLLKGRLQAGESIRPDDVAARFGMSAVPVREALRVLVTEGWIEYAPHRGYRVRAHSFADVEEIFLMCRLLEAEALRRGVPEMGSEGAARMEALLRELEVVPKQGDVWEKVMIHRDFHFVPIEHAGLPRLEAELRHLWDHTDHYRGLHFFADEAEDASMAKEHWRIFEACAEGDSARAIQLMDEHRGHALQILSAAVQPDS